MGFFFVLKKVNAINAISHAMRQIRYLSHMRYRIAYPVPTSSSGYAESPRSRRSWGTFVAGHPGRHRHRKDDCCIIVIAMGGLLNRIRTGVDVATGPRCAADLNAIKEH